jgi:hypothetical protein
MATLLEGLPKLLYQNTYEYNGRVRLEEADNLEVFYDNLYGIYAIVDVDNFLSNEDENATLGFYTEITLDGVTSLQEVKEFIEKLDLELKEAEKLLKELNTEV